MRLTLHAADALWEELGPREGLEASATEACEPDHLPSAKGWREGLDVRRGVWASRRQATGGGPGAV